MKKQVIRKSAKSVEVQVDVVLIKEGDFFVALCPSLNVSSYGHTEKEARSAFDEALHIFIDALTCYGTGWFEPFNHHRVTMNVLFVADPFYTIALLISFIALLILKTKNKNRKIWIRFGLYVSTFYLIYAFINKIIW